MSSGRFQMQEPRRRATLIPHPSGAETSWTISLQQCVASLWLMHSSVLFLFVLMTGTSLVGIWWLFANTADAYAYTCHYSPPCLLKRPLPECSSVLTWIGCQWLCRETARRIFHWRYRRHETRKWAAIASQHVLCFGDKAIIHHRALDSQKPLSISPIFLYIFKYTPSIMLCFFQVRWTSFYALLMDSI